ncbi:MAM domain-containing protein 2a isoform X1 [Scyliorhinus canicula]|uniref:MAM domain-containing protein 2a isoform X1 n=2 Tax=Scyliorhinus canicula TaxID=7830 RepID=UPI0018F4EFFC|nr:MAM domain-containing protein 2a isoform X1 [Scyliorhinus canicula]
MSPLTLLILHAVQFASGEFLGSNGSCDFEDDTCGYASDPDNDPWIVNLQGRYVYIEGSPRHYGKVGLLTSPQLRGLGESCVRLVYQITGTDAGRLNMYFRPEGNSFDFLLWSANQPSDSWKIASIGVSNITDRSKIILEGAVIPDPKASIAVFEINISPGYCIVCTFEENHLCGYNNRWNPNLNWLVGGGSVRDSPTNLPTDHTWDNEHGHYMYVDAIYTTSLHEVAHLMSPVTTSALSGCLSFFYQLEQSRSNLFIVYTKDRMEHYEEVWRANKSTHNWSLVTVNIKASHPFQVVFEVAFSSTKGGYAALDDISFSSQFCHNKTELVFDPSVANCDFDEGLCNYSQNHNDGTKWTRLVRKANAFRFGDHTSGEGGFLISNTRFGYQQEYVSHLSGPLLLANLQYCLQFFYAQNHFVTEDALAVYISDEEDRVQEKIWSIPKSHTGMWMQAEVNYHRQEPTKIVFVSVCKNFWNCGKVALDDITVSLGDCRIPGGSWLPTPGKCSFDGDNCGFLQDHDDKGNWYRRTGTTPTSFTGPKGDHTTGVGRYMYIEASHMRQGYKARLLSWQLRGFTGNQCLIFFYHMYGLGTGSLNVYLRKGNAHETLLWKIRGEQSMSWMKASIEYKCEKSHQIVFEAIRGGSIHSDIAIDDVLFQSGPCEDTRKTLPHDPESSNQPDWYSLYA